MEGSDPVLFRIHICNKGEGEQHFHILITNPVHHPSLPMWDKQFGEIFIAFSIDKGILPPSARQQFLTLWDQRKVLSRLFPESLSEPRYRDIASLWKVFYDNGIGNPFYLDDKDLPRILLCSFVEFPGSHAGLHEEKMVRTLASDCYPLDIEGKRVLAKIP